MNNVIVNFILNIPIKIGLKKRKVGIRIKNSSNIKITESRISGYRKGVDVNKVTNLDVTNTNIN